MDDLPEVNPRELPVSVSDEDALDMLRGIAVGWYTTSDLYPRYMKWADRKGQAPATRQALGVALRRVTADSRPVRGGARAWRITSNVLEGRNWFRDPR